MEVIDVVINARKVLTNLSLSLIYSFLHGHLIRVGLIEAQFLF